MITDRACELLRTSVAGQLQFDAPPAGVEKLSRFSWCTSCACSLSRADSLVPWLTASLAAGLQGISDGLYG